MIVYKIFFKKTRKSLFLSCINKKNLLGWEKKGNSMRKILLTFLVFGGLLTLSTVSYARCRNDSLGGWRCFPDNDASQASNGDCKDMNCPNGCVEDRNGAHGHCCPTPTATDCRSNVYSEGCLSRIKVDCLPNQFCNEKRVCQDK